MQFALLRGPINDAFKKISTADTTEHTPQESVSTKAPIIDQKLLVQIRHFNSSYKI
jgi:hypothetical protein